MNMSSRERLLSAIRLEEPDVVPVCPLADNNYASFVCGVKGYEANWRHQIAAAREIGYDAIIFPDNYNEIVEKAMPTLKWKRKIIETGVDFRIVESRLETPHGPLISRSCERARSFTFPIKYPITSLEADYEKIVWFYKQLAAGEYDVINSYNEIRKKLGDQGLVCARSGVMLRERLEESVVSRYRHPNLVKEISSLAFESNKPLLKAAFKAGADLIFVGGLNIGAFLPRMNEVFDLPRAKLQIDFIRKGGALSYLHCCSKPCNMMLEKLAELNPDLIETLPPPPSGDVDLGDAKRRIGDKVCLKGNLNLTLLYSGTRNEIEKAVRDCIKKAGSGGGYILGTEDGLQWGHPIENIRAMVTFGRKYGVYPTK